MISSEQPVFLIWLSIVVAASWTIPSRWISGWLAVSSGLFLAVYAPLSLATLMIITILCGLAMKHARDYPWGFAAVIAISIGGLLIYRVLTQNSDFLVNVSLLGMSFYILRATHLLFECHAGRQEPVPWFQMIAWLWFLPTLQVGPIHRFGPFRQDLLRRRWDNDLFSKGLERLVFGFFKIIVLANYLVNVKYNQWLAQFSNDSWWYHYLDSVRYGLHLYLKFSGYSDIAVGFALLLGFRVMENFNFPFFATNISDFWNRWHISLSAWCRDYVYAPVLAYSRHASLAAIASMLALGIWHELSMRYLIWGIWHGVGIAIYQAWTKTRMQSTLNNSWLSVIWIPTAGFITLNFVILSFTFTGTESLGESVDRWRILLAVAF